MDYQHIAQNFPKTMERISSFFLENPHAKNFLKLSDGTIGVFNVPVHSYQLIEFLDAFCIFVNAVQYDDGDFYATIHMFEVFSNRKIEIEGHLEVVYEANKFDNDFTFDNRLEAMCDGFNEAFRILESKLP